MSKIFKAVMTFEYDTSEEQWGHIETKNDVIEEVQNELDVFGILESIIEVKEIKDEENDTEVDN